LLGQFAREVPGFPEPGDIVLFRVGRLYSHSGIVIAWPLIVHAHWISGVELADASKAPLERRGARFFRPNDWL
jgi:cell wall-associated NlpC family hydrolase